MVRRVMAVLAVLFLTTNVARAADDLNVGDPAPKLEVKEFVKGDAVKSLDKGKIYVVEFWATWCGPCIATIPHLTELQKKHPDVTFIGVSAFESDFGKVKPFVADMGEKMEYRVAMDAVPEGKKANDGAMAKNWMDAASQPGIPTAFIVNADGKVAWIGHPARMDQPLADIVAGTWDLAAATTKFKQDIAQQRKMQAILAKVNQARQAKDPKAIIEAVESAIQDDAKLEIRLAGMKFSALCDAGNFDAAATYGRKLIGDVYKSDPMMLNELSWGVVDPTVVQKKKPDTQVLRVAIDAAIKANELAESKDANILDTLAQAHFLNNDFAKAVDFQEKAVKLNPENPEMKERLAAFKKALDKK